jgi:hypothetical protein
MRGIRNACLGIIILAVLGLVLATCVFPDDISPRRDYRIQLEQIFVKGER